MSRIINIEEELIRIAKVLDGTLEGDVVAFAVRIVKRCGEAEQEIKVLRTGIAQCLSENAHLADGDDCTLLSLKKLINLNGLDHDQA